MIKSILLKSVMLSGLAASAFSVNLFSQTLTAEKTGTVAAFTRGTEEVAKLAATGIVESKPRRSLTVVNPSPDRIFELEKQAFALINRKRAETGLNPLAWSDEVARVARLHSENMVKFKFFNHKDADGKMVDGRADALGLTNWTAMGENIAYNRGFKDPIETAVEKWMLSEGHRQNLLNDRWKESAIGIAVTDDGTFYFTQVFLKRK